jgi:hypothetical protein
MNGAIWSDSNRPPMQLSVSEFLAVAAAIGGFVLMIVKLSLRPLEVKIDFIYQQYKPKHE